MAEKVKEMLGNTKDEMDVFKRLTLLYERKKKEGCPDGEIHAALIEEIEALFGKLDTGSDATKAAQDQTDVFDYLIMEYEKKKKVRNVAFEDIYKHLRTEIVTLFGLA
jgi:hypothetical protein